MRIYSNGNVVDEKEAVVSVYDHGFLYGIGLFETFRTYGGIPFLLEEHLLRLAAGCAELDIEFQPDPVKIQQIITTLLEANHLQDGYFRYTVSAGTDLLGLPSSSYTKPAEIMYVKELPPRSADFTVGKPLQRLRLPRNTPEGSIRWKSLHYMNNILAKRELQSYPWATGAEGLLLTREGYVAEGIVSSLFFIKNGVCFTPSLETGILPGITRAFIIRLTEQLQNSICEGYYTWEDLVSADEIFITNSIQEIVPVKQLFTCNGQMLTVGSGLPVPGSFTLQFMKLYQQYVGSGL